jgi:hypothetical protein
MLFPTSPAIGQVFTSGGRSWVWTGSTWDSPARDNPTIQGLVEVFANATDRTAAIPFPTEGMATYLLDTNYLETYSGTAWVPTVSNNAFTTYTPIVTAATGSLTTVSATGAFKLIGKVCHTMISIVITNNGTAGTALYASLPVTQTGQSATGLYRENAVTGLSGQVFVSSNNSVWFTPSNGYPGGNNYNLVTSFSYGVA